MFAFDSWYYIKTVAKFNYIERDLDSGLSFGSFGEIVLQIGDLYMF